MGKPDEVRSVSLQGDLVITGNFFIFIFIFIFYFYYFFFFWGGGRGGRSSIEMGNMGGEGNHLIVDTSNGACMKSQGMELLDFVEFLEK